MKVLIYNELNPKTIPGFAKLKKYLEEDDDFKSAEVKKVGDNLSRARLNQHDRLIFSVYHHQQESYVLLLEFVKNHAYQDSQFLRQASACMMPKPAYSLPAKIPAWAILKAKLKRLVLVGRCGRSKYTSNGQVFGFFGRVRCTLR